MVTCSGRRGEGGRQVKRDGRICIARFRMCVLTMVRIYLSSSEIVVGGGTGEIYPRFLPIVSPIHQSSNNNRDKTRKEGIE